MPVYPRPVTPFRRNRPRSLQRLFSRSLYPNPRRAGSSPPRRSSRFRRLVPRSADVRARAGGSSTGAAHVALLPLHLLVLTRHYYTDRPPAQQQGIDAVMSCAHAGVFGCTCVRSGARLPGPHTQCCPSTQQATSPRPASSSAHRARRALRVPAQRTVPGSL